MRRFWAIAALVSLCAAVPAPAGMLSKTYVFKTDVALETDVVTDDGLRLDSVRFTLPSTRGGQYMRTGGLAEAEVAVSNTGNTSLKAGIAIALFDPDGRLVGVASGGSNLGSLKPDRRKTFKLVFDHVNTEAFRATTFQVSVESRQ